MEKNSGLAIVLSSIILGSSFIFAASKISNSIDNSGRNISDSNYEIASSINSGSTKSENFELVVSDGWLYLHDTTNGQVWKKADNADATWEIVKHYGD